MPSSAPTPDTTKKTTRTASSEKRSPGDRTPRRSWVPARPRHRLEEFEFSTADHADLRGWVAPAGAVDRFQLDSSQIRIECGNRCSSENRQLFRRSWVGRQPSVRSPGFSRSGPSKRWTPLRRVFEGATGLANRLPVERFLSHAGRLGQERFEKLVPQDESGVGQGCWFDHGCVLNDNMMNTRVLMFPTSAYSISWPDST